MTKRFLLLSGVGVLAALLIGIWIGTRWSSPTEPATAATSSGGALPYRAGPFQLAIDVQPEAPVVGKNRLHIVLRDAQGQPVEDAEIRAVAEMPAMGAMPAMQAPAELREIAPGSYEGPFDLSMEGAWPLTLRFEVPGTPARPVSFDMATGRAGLTPSTGISGGPGAEEELPAGTITIDARRRQLIGITTARAEIRPLTRAIRAVGRVVVDERRIADVSLKYEAWIGELHADFVGAQVRRGDVLFTIYSPALYAAQEEYVQTYRRKLAPDLSPGLLAAARQRLEFWDVDEAFIRALEQRGTPVKYVPIRAPQSGTVITKNVVEGTAHRGGMTLLRIADLSRVWVEAEIYEADLPLVSVGMQAIVTLPYLTGEEFKGRVDYLYPYLQGESRTGRVRFSLANPEGVLKPDMFADVKLEQRLPERLAVPESSVIIAGQMRVVFEDLGEGRLAPRIVKTGWQADGWIEILEGLKAGDAVVTSGNFLIASESRLRAGIEQW